MTLYTRYTLVARHVPLPPLLSVFALEMRRHSPTRRDPVVVSK